MPDARREDIAKLESLYAEHPEGRIFTHLAEAYRKVGELDRAGEVLREGLERHPDYSSAHVVMGRVLADQGRSEDAEAAFQRVLELDAHNLVALRALGDLARADGRESDAVDYYARLLNVEPADDQVRELMDSLTAEEAAQSETPSGEPAPDEGEPALSGDEEEVTVEPWSTPDEDEEGFEPWASSEDEVETFEPWAASEEEGEDEEEPFEPWAVADEGSEAAAWSPDEGSDAAADTESTGLEAPGAGPDEPAAGDLEAEVEGGGEAGGWSPGDAYGLPDASGDDEPPSMTPGVMTETIAQVYARQGLYDRAAEVYRELVRERPDESELRSRLQEMEDLAKAAPASLQDLESEDFDPTEADAEPMPGLETAEIDPDTGLSQVGLPEQSSPEPWDSESSPDEWLPPDAGGFDMPQSDAEFAGGAVGDGSDGEADDAAEEDSVWVGGDWNDVTEETPYAWAGPESDVPEDASAPIGSYFRSLLSWTPGAADDAGDAGGGVAADADDFGDAGDGQDAHDADDFGDAGDGQDAHDADDFGDAGVASASETTGETSADAPGDPVGSEGAGSAFDDPATLGADGGGGTTAADDEDDDLDTFRSWLENLKQ